MTVPLINTLVTAGKDIYNLMNLPFFLSSCTKPPVFHLDFKLKQEMHDLDWLILFLTITT